MVIGVVDMRDTERQGGATGVEFRRGSGLLEQANTQQIAVKLDGSGKVADEEYGIAKLHTAPFLQDSTGRWHKFPV